MENLSEIIRKEKILLWTLEINIVMSEGPQPYQPNASCVLIKFNCGRCEKLMRDNKKKENNIVDPRDQYCDV